MKLIRQLLLPVLLLISAPLLAAVDQVLIIKSNDNSFFNTTIDQIKASSDGQLKFKITNLENLKSEQQNLEQTDFILTLGYRAADYVKNLKVKKPVLASYITQFEFHRLKQHKNFHALLLEQPLDRYIRFIKALFPAQSIGLIKNENHQLSKKVLKNYQNKLNVTIDQHIYISNPNPVEIARQLLGQNDVLLALPDSNIYNRQSLKGILLTSYRNRKPFISYSPAHVKSGALAAIFASPIDIGEQIAGMLDRLHKSDSFHLKSEYFANTFNIVVNQQVAKSLELELADEKSIRQTLNETGK